VLRLDEMLVDSRPRKSCMRNCRRVQLFAAMILCPLLLCLTGCELVKVGTGPGSVTPGLTYRRPYAWPVSTPSAQGMDSIRTLAGLQQIQKAPFLLSFLVIKNDLLVFEYYAPGIVPENDFNVHGISASVTSALVGIALDRRLLQSVDELILKFFPSFDTTRINPRKRTWTVEHLLTMRSGMEWNEYENHSTLFNSGTNWINTALGLPLASAPGDSFVFTSPNANILAAMIARVSGMSAYRFAEKNLFGPLNIAVRDWSRDPQDLYLGGTGMRFTPRDLARFGQLYLRNGLLEGKQIVSRSWIQQSVMPRNALPGRRGEFTSLNYGYLWWTNYAESDSLFFASGYGGQMILVVPNRSLVIVTIADEAVTMSQAELNERELIALLRKYFL